MGSIGKQNVTKLRKRSTSHGLAASQARLLFLTSRLSDLELRAQTISNSKIRLADESKTASDEYCRALDKKKFHVATGADKNGPKYDDATVNNLTGYNEGVGHQRLIKDGSGRLIVSEMPLLQHTIQQYTLGMLPQI